MGRCHEFGLQIHDGCGHPMVAGDSACACSECGVVCGGRFAGCPDVWARGPQPVTLVAETAVDDPLAVPAPADGNGRRRSDWRAPAVVEATAESVTEPQPAQAAQAEAAAALRWLEAAFAGLRDELQAVRTSLEHQHAFLVELTGGMAKQQALLDELLTASEGNTRLKTVAQALPGLVGMAVTRAVEASDTRAATDVEAAIARAVEGTEARALAALDDAIGQAVEVILGRHPAAEHDHEAVPAGARALVESDPATGSAIAAIAAQAADHSVRSEIAEQLPQAVEKVLAGSEARLEHLVEHMDEVVARAARLATPPAAPKAPKARAARSTKKATAAPAKAAPRKTVRAAPGTAAKAKAKAPRSKATKSVKSSAPRQPRKATRTSPQATRPSRRSLGT